MKLAFVTSLAPTVKPDTGFEIANAAIVDALRAEGHQVTIFAFARPDDALRDDSDLVLFGRLTIENHAAGPSRKLLWLASAILLGLPFACAKLWLAGRDRIVQSIKDHGPFDRIILNSVMMPGAFPALSNIARTVVVAHNIEHGSAAENARHASSRLMRWLYAREARLLERIETDLARKSDFIWCLADEDRSTLARLAGADIIARSAVLPLVPVQTDVRHDKGTPPVFDIGMIGTWTWEPNLIGLKWFLSEVVPRLPSTLRIAVAGRTPADIVAPANVTLLGRVPDAADFLADCAVVALASRAGTGVQLKTIQTLQLGLPAVATSLSMRGLGTPPENVRLSDDPYIFAAKLVEHVAGVRSGQVQRIDGSAFMRTQSNALKAAISAGLVARTPKAA